MRRELLPLFLAACAGQPRWPAGDVSVEILEAPPGSEAAVRRALATWNAALRPHDVVLVPRAKGDVLIRWSDEPRPYVAWTVANYELGDLTSATVSIRRGEWSLGEECKRGYDLEATLAHELGHAIGLEHVADPGATMYALTEPCDTGKRDLSESDLQEMAALYGGGEAR